MTRTAADIIEEWEQGIWATAEVTSQLLRRALEVPLDDVVAALEEPWRSRFTQWLDEMFNNDLPFESFVYLRPRPDEDRRLFQIAREWLSRQRRADGRSSR